MKVLITGGAGFIGYHLCKKLAENNNIVLIDNINSYYDINLKKMRLKSLGLDKNKIEEDKTIISNKNGNLKFFKMNLEEKDKIFDLFQQEKFDYVINLAAQAGVRYSLQNPYSYINSNILGFLNILEACRAFPVKHLIFASSSSVYGLNKDIPFSEKHKVDQPASLYAATKKSNELMAHTYSHLFNIPTTGLRFFTVYGPWGRPDMAYFIFTNKILKGIPIEIYNYGRMKRDFTYIDDIIDGITKLITHIPKNSNNFDNQNCSVPYRIYNIGNNEPIELNYFINLLEEYLGKKAIKRLLPMQLGDVVETYADISSLFNEVNFKPTTNVESGLKKFIDWYKKYYNI